MSDLNADFAAAMTDSKSLTERPDNETLLKLYALYKQGSEGDVSTERPGMMDMVGRMKFDAWTALKGVPPDNAKRDYIALVESLK